MTREITSGETLADFKVDRKDKMGLGVVLWRATRWSVQSGILDAELTRSDVYLFREYNA